METIESLNQSPGIGGRALVNEDVNMVDIAGTDEEVTSGAKEGEKAGGGRGGLDKSIHAVGGGDEKKGKGKAKVAEEGEKSRESKGWRYYSMYDDRTIGDMIRDIIAAAAAMVEAKEKGIKGSAYRDWVEVTNQMIITTENTIERGIHMEMFMKEGHTRGGWSRSEERL